MLEAAVFDLLVICRHNKCIRLGKMHLASMYYWILLTKCWFYCYSLMKGVEIMEEDRVTPVVSKSGKGSFQVLTRRGLNQSIEVTRTSSDGRWFQWVTTLMSYKVCRRSVWIFGFPRVWGCPQLPRSMKCEYFFRIDSRKTSEDYVGVMMISPQLPTPKRKECQSIQALRVAEVFHPGCTSSGHLVNLLQLVNAKYKVGYPRLHTVFEIRTFLWGAQGE